MVATLAYWKIRGFAQQIRFLLEFTGTPYTDKQYTFADGKQEWTDEKFNLGLTFPNLPYFLDGDIKISQTYCIMRYIARKAGMEPKTDDEKLRVDLIECQLGDMRTAWATLVYRSTDFENDKKTYMSTTFPLYMKQLSEFLGKRKWLAGENLTHVDFAMYELLEINEMFNPGCLKSFANVDQYRNRFMALDAISKYIKSDRFIRTPINGPHAKFNG